LETLREIVELEYSIQSVLASAKIADGFRVEELRALGVFVEIRGGHGAQSLSFQMGPQRRFVTLFSNGTATIRGCRSISEAQSLLEDVRRVLRRFAKVKKGKLRTAVQNIVALADVGTQLDLVKLSQSLASWDILYEPEQFPGLVLRPGEGKATLLVFSSGKLVIVGTRSEDELAAVLRETRPFLEASGR